MSHALEAVDPMVIALSVAVEETLAKNKNIPFQICMSEALMNLVKHTNCGSDGAQIEIVLSMNEDDTTVEIFDPIGAVPFDLRDHATKIASVDAMAEGGRGLGLILECADLVDYGLVNGRNRLLLGFRNVE